ncbi:MAG: ACP S-malonyltransferase [Candidatus Omnitrophota bacterium]|nr:ACP S-malonyltransferase [Candidatus Omnitrophota bacterium]MBU1928512.1 ACP S-malonyltransferase [Candidatus Omnitrophota bacterium]MBU2034715.1 ACP S-malonyltransferase [Candidatus Omnitrophota bacterium]MBU2258184.1 ACP S-malonyltransferase [Candidatus Omnitrophota bacterium]
MVGYLFAGQGSQYIGMGKDLYESFPESKSIFDEADKVLGFSISRLCFYGPIEELTKTANCQPAIVTASIAAWEAFKKVTKTQIHHDTSYTAGLSLGQYSALVASEVMTFADTVYLARCRGEFMEEEAAKRPGKMLSVIGLELSKIKEICAETNIEIANLNCPGQIVISGPAEGVIKAQELAMAKGAKMAVLLEVSGAFHSSLMQGASVKLAKELEKIRISPPKMTLVSNVTGKPISSPEEIRVNLINQIAQSVLWEDSIRYMLGSGMKKFYEFGPGKVLKGLMRRIDPEAVVVNIDKKADLDSVGSM